MKRQRGLAIDNSFTLKFENTTNAVTRISLFEQGGSGITQAQEVDAGEEVAYGGNLVLPALIWNFASAQPFYYNGTPNIPKIPNGQFFDVNLWQNQSAGNLRITADSGTFIDVPLALNDTINQVNEKIQASIEANADTTNFQSPSGKFAQIRILFDVNHFNQYLDLLPLPITFAEPRSSWGVSVQYPPDATNRWASFNFPNNPNPEISQGAVPMELQRTASANGVIIAETQGVSYEEILRSQTGSAYDVMYMGLDLGLSPNQDERDAQMLQPFCFTKYDVNGNELTYCKVPTKDPYQFQDSYGVIDMGIESDKYVLDGRTKFGYALQPQTSVFLTYNYSQITNLVFDTEYGLEKAREEQRKLRQYDRNKNINRVLKLDIPTTKETKKPNKFSNFTNNVFKSKPKLRNALLGIGAIFLIYKLNQTK